MKKILYIVLLFIAFSCSKDEKISVELGSYKRTYDVNSSDPVLKYVSIYNQYSGKHFIIDPDTTDYLFNLDKKNPIIGYATPKDETYILRGIKMVEELFLNSYTKEAQAKIMPNSLILFDTLYSTVGWMPEKVTHYVSRSIMGFGYVKIASIYGNEGEKVKASRKMHIELFTNVIIPYNSRLDLTDFFNVSKGYGELAGTTRPSEAQLNEMGFLEFIGSWTAPLYPFKVNHAAKWFEFMLTKTDEQKKELADKYPKMKLNMEMMDKCLKKSLDIDYRNLVYKAK